MKSSCSHLPKAASFLAFGGHNYYRKCVSYKHKLLQLGGASFNREALSKDAPPLVSLYVHKGGRTHLITPHWHVWTYVVIQRSAAQMEAPAPIQPLDLMVPHPTSSC